MTLGQGGGCGLCGRVAYCGADCQVEHWARGHEQDCAALVHGDIDGEIQPIDARFAVVQAGKNPVLQGGRKLTADPKDSWNQDPGGPFALLLAQLDPARGVLNGLFTAIRYVQLDMRRNAWDSLSRTRVLCEEEASRWLKLRPGINGADGAGLTALEQWQRARARDDKNETAADRLIEYYQDRINSLEDVVAANNLILGPGEIPNDAPSAEDVAVTGTEEEEESMSPVPIRRTSPRSSGRKPTPPAAAAPPQNSFGRTRVAPDRFVEKEPAVRANRPKAPTKVSDLDAYATRYPAGGWGLTGGRWKTDNPGIYLLYDWDVVYGRIRNPQLEDTEMGRAIQAARLEWQKAFVTSLKAVDALVGMNEAKTQLVKMITTLLVNPSSARNEFLNIAIMGPAGTGKTSLATLLPAVFYRLGYAPRPYYDNVAPVTTKADWVAPYEGQSAHQARMTMMRGLGRVTIFDEAYSLTEGSDSSGFGREALTQIVNDLDQFRGMTIMCVLGYESQMRQMFAANSGMGRRFPEQWVIGNYSPEQLLEILFARAVSRGFELAAGVRGNPLLLDFITEMSAHGVFADTNASAMGRIIKIYDNIRSKAILEKSVLSGKLSVAAPLIMETNTLIEAMTEYARTRGFNVYIYDE